MHRMRKSKVSAVGLLSFLLGVFFLSKVSSDNVSAPSFPAAWDVDERQSLEDVLADHTSLGAEQELFFSHPVSPGSYFFLPHGTRIYNRLVKFIRDQYWKRGLDEVVTPNMFDIHVFETSGHARKYKENMFILEIENQEFALKPMNCPGHCLMFTHRVRSYKELPLRFAEFGVLHRNEASDALTGLTRVRRFQMDGAHIFCRESQIKDEVRAFLEFVRDVYGVFGLTFDLNLSTRPENYIGDKRTWEKAESTLTEALNEFGKPWQKDEGEGAFYGPKIDVTVSDAFNMKIQCATLQLDFQLPVRFGLSYSTEDESKSETPVMIHQAVLGSVERMFAILLEHYQGKWPFWLSPRQAIVFPVSEKSRSYSLKVRDQIHHAGYYVDFDKTDRKIQEKVSEARLVRYNYILVVGEEAAGTGQVTVHVRDEADKIVMTVADLLKVFEEKSAAFH
ncbi:hypothetical protein ACJRO7_033802 [Eucalyptus globulus]|uniref:threonine--tRNA ligase n=1 Tax=Eucalyptus globulus TaxID=34317 RepID=A0ABD3J596_EUCGL